MKKIILIILLFPVFFNSAIAQKTNYHFALNGKLKNQDTGLMLLYYSGKDNKREEDSAVITDGKFSFKGNISGPTMAYLLLKEEKRNENNSVSFFLEPTTMTVVLQMNKFGEAKFTGSKTQNEYATLETKRLEVQERWKIVMDTLTEVNKRSNVQYQELKDWVLQPYFSETKNLDYTFFTLHPQSYVTAYMLRFHVNDLSLDSLQMFYNRLGKNIQKSIDGKDLAEEIKKIRAGSPGSVATNFTATDINGRELSLSDFKGKYVLLDFWASWCVPCRAGNPHLKELYAKYKDKGIEFIGVSDDDSKPGAWHKAVEKDGLQWRQVLRGLDMEKSRNNEPNEKDISEKYGISSLPTKILIDPQGKIIGRFSDEKGPLDKELKKIFGT